jgi:hypothetical protein
MRSRVYVFPASLVTSRSQVRRYLTSKRADYPNPILLEDTIMAGEQFILRAAEEAAELLGGAAKGGGLVDEAAGLLSGGARVAAKTERIAAEETPIAGWQFTRKVEEWPGQFASDARDKAQTWLLRHTNARGDKLDALLGHIETLPPSTQAQPSKWASVLEKFGVQQVPVKRAAGLARAADKGDVG